MSEQPRSDEPLYNIGAVSKMTDVAETTLRIWERRYDFPESSRTDGGHRLYSQREVSRLQWVKARMDEGMQVSRAIKALHHAETEGEIITITSLISEPETLGTADERLWNALIAHDTDTASRIITEILSVYPLEHLILEVISPLMAAIGDAWEADEIDVLTEHFATNFLRNYLFQWMSMGPPAYDVNPVVLACAPGELHEGSLLMFAVLLRRLRWPVTYLGQTIVLKDFDAFVKRNDPSVIVFVAMTEESVQALRDWPQLLPNIRAEKVAFGGRIFVQIPAYIEQVEGIYLGETLREGVAALNNLLHDMYPLAR